MTDKDVEFVRNKVKQVCEDAAEEVIKYIQDKVEIEVTQKDDSVIVRVKKIQLSEQKD